MRFVHGEERDVDALESFDEVRAAKAFGRDIDELVTALPDACDARLLFFKVHGTVDERGGQPARLERVHLILHQRDERRDDDRHALAHQRGKLETERLAAARRHHDHGVVSVEDGFDHFALTGAERLKVEMFAEGGEG